MVMILPQPIKEQGEKRKHKKETPKKEGENVWPICKR